MAFGNEPGYWNYGLCEVCMKNGGESVRMVRECIEPGCPEYFVCPQCGATKRL